MKLSKQTILIGISTLVVAGAGLAYYFITKDKEDVLGWKDASWLYRKSIAVANSGSTLTNEDVLIEVDTATLISNSKLQNTCADLRFTDSDDNTYLAYWIEGGCNTATTQVWVRIPSLTAGGKTIYMYYGNEAAGSSEESWAGKFILMKDTACDSGWTTESESGGDFYQRYPYPATTYGETGGATGYDHPTLTRATSTVSTGTATNIGAGLGQAGAHSHNNVSFVIPSVTALPPYLNMIFCSNNKLIAKQNSVSIFASTVPTGFTRFAALDNKFPRGEATYGGTSTTTTHTHTVTAVTTSSLSASRTCASGSTATPSSTHTHTFAAFATGTGNQTPVYKTTIYGEANSDITAPSGIIEMVNSVPPMGWTQYSALDGYFPFGATTFGTTGGSATHTHSISARTSGAYSGSVTCSTAATTASVPRAHTHTTSATTSGTASNLPPYIQTILVQKKTSQPITFNSEERKNESPTAPTALQTEGATDPSSIIDLTPEFSAIFNDPNTIDSASYYQIEVNTASDFTGTIMWDSTQTSLSPEVANGNRSQDISYAGSTLQEGATYYWRIKFWDNNTSQGVLSSDWSSTAQFTVDIFPNAPTSLLTEGTTNPITVSDTTPEFSAIFSDSNSSDVGSYYQIEVNTASDFTGTIMWDSTQTSLSPEVANGVRSQDISYAGSALQEGTTYYWRIKFWDNHGAVSQWTSANFVINEAPSLPYGLEVAGLVNPNNLTDNIPKFSAVFSDPNTSNTARHYQIQVNTSSDFTGTTVWDSTKTSMTPPLSNGNRSQDLSFGGSNLNAYRTYYWRIKLWDNHGSESDWSEVAQFRRISATWRNASFLYKVPVIADNTSGQIIAKADDTSSSTSALRSIFTPSPAFAADLILTEEEGEDVLIQVDTATLIAAGKMQEDCDDIRFFDSDDTTAIDYWVEGECNTDSTQIWVRVPLPIPIDGKTIYMYYGDPEATNGEVEWTGNNILFADTTCPAGWTRASDLDNKFLYGGTTYGTTGGGTSHTHSDATCTSSSIDTTSITGTIGGSLTGTTTTHTHTNLRATLLSASVVPPYEGMIACYSNSFLLSQGLISMFDTSTPSGWTRYSELDDRFVQAKDTYGETGGSATHTHSTTTGYTTESATGTQAVASSSPATGGTITTSGPYTIHTFTSSGTLTVLDSVTADILVVGGGGGGGSSGANYGSGGGGGGGVVYQSGVQIAVGEASVVVGNGGAVNSNGGNSIFQSITGYGGGAGGIYQTSAGSNGGCGGGGGGNYPSAGFAGGSGTQGYSGGSGYNSGGDPAGGGGGGMGSIGLNGGTGPGNGGAGISNSITGTSLYYGGGGGGGGAATRGLGGSSIGGNGAYNNPATNSTPGVDGRGGGGGGGGYLGKVGSAGGSGVVIVRYLTPTGGGDIASSTHTHDSTDSTPSTVSNLPPYLDMVFAKANTDQYVTDNNVIATTELPPLGWSRFTDLDDRFPRGSSTNGATGGSTTHTHDVTVNTGSPSATIDGGGTGTNYADSTHTHSCTTTSDTGSNLPPYTTVIYAQRKTSEDITLLEEQLGNIKPDKPTNLLTENLSNPLNITDSTPEFSALFTDGNPEDIAKYYQIQVNTASDFTGTVMWDSTKAEYSPVVTNGNQSQDISYAGSELQPGTPYYWRIKFWDDHTLGSKESEWSDANSFIPQASPATPTSLQTNGTTNPTVLTNVPPSFTAIYSDANSDIGSAYQIQVNSNALFTGTVMWDSGKVSATITSGQRCPAYEYNGTQLENTNATLYWRIKFWDALDAPSEWSATAQFQDTVTHTYYEGLRLEGIKLD